MSDIITTAGLQNAFDAGDTFKFSRRREVLKEIRSKLRNPQSSDEEYEDALDALIELTGDPDTKE